MDKQDKEFEAYLRKFRLRQPGLPPEIVSVSRRSSMRWLLAAAVVVLAVGISAVLVRNSGSGSGPKATVEAAGSPSMYRVGETIEAGQVVQSNSAVGLVLALEDGSRIEMREQSELKVESAGDGLLVRLNDGRILVTAAKQAAGRHIYVQTRDAMVSVVGTVFLVSTEQSGTTVAVVEGEVQVQQGAELKKLLPGEQVATNPSMQMKPVAEQISWSHSAVEYLALLQQPSTPVAPSPADPVAASPRGAEPEAVRPAGLPFQIQTSYVRVTDDQVRTLITVQFLNRNLAFRDEAGGKRARIHIEGRIYRMDNRRVSNFSQDLGVEFDSNTFLSILDKPTLFQETSLLTPGKYRLHITVEDKNAQSVGVRDQVLMVPQIQDPTAQSEPTRVTSGKHIFDRECTSCHNAEVATRMQSRGVPLSMREQNVLSFIRVEMRKLSQEGRTREAATLQQSIAEVETREAGVEGNYRDYVSRHLGGFGKTLSTEEVSILIRYIHEETSRKLELQDRPATPPAAPAQPNDVPKEDPDVAGIRILNSACTGCHDLGAVTGRKEDRASWERIVIGMNGYGAGVKDSEIPVLVDYLFKRYGPPKEAPAPPVRRP